MSRKKQDAPGEATLASNRAAAHEYHLLKRYEAGIALTGPEVKSARARRVNLKDAYARIRQGEVFLHAAHFSPYTHARSEDHDPVRVRKLLLHAREIVKLKKETEGTGMTLVPTRLYASNGKIKIEIAVAKGKRAYDKRESKKRQEAEREMARARGSRRIE